MSTQTEKAIEKVNAIYDKLPISECLKVWEESGKHIHDRITKHQEEKGKEIQEMAELKNKLSVTITK